MIQKALAAVGAWFIIALVVAALLSAIIEGWRKSRRDDD
jgi:hypothetical protein